MSRRESVRRRLATKAAVISPERLQQARANVLQAAQDRIEHLRGVVMEVEEIPEDDQIEFANMEDQEFLLTAAKRFGPEIVEKAVTSKLPRDDWKTVQQAPQAAAVHQQQAEAAMETIQTVTGKSISEFASDQQQRLLEAFPADAAPEEYNARLLNNLAQSFGPDQVLDAFERGDLDEEDFREAGLLQRQQEMQQSGLSPEMEAQVDKMSTQDLAKLIDSEGQSSNGFTAEEPQQAAEIQPDDPPHISPDDLTDEQLRGLIDG